MTDRDQEFERLLAELNTGSEGAAERIWECVYGELRALAQHRIAKLAPGQTLQSTALVNEAWLRLGGGDERRATNWESRAHFFGAAARAMRNILVDRARERDSLRRGGAAKRERLTGLDVAALGEEQGLIELDEALTKLEEVDARAARIVGLRYFAGLTIDETAKVVGLSAATIEREWSFAKAWLKKALTDEGAWGGLPDQP